MTGTNFSSWYRADEGTVYTEFDTAAPTTARIFQIGDGTGNNRMDGFLTSNFFTMFVQTNNSAQVNALSTGTIAANVFGKVSFAYKIDDFAWLLNAGTVATDTSGVVPVVNQIGIGRRLDAATVLNGHMRRIVYYPARLSNTQLEALTKPAATLGIAANFPSVRPSLRLDFASSKQLDPRVTFVRTSTASYYDASGVLQTAAANTPRFDHNPATGESLGLLIEEQRVNIYLQSEAFDNASWGKNRSSVTADAAVAPTGTSVADKLVEDTSTNTHFIFQDISLTANTVYTFSCYVKSTERNVYIETRFSANWAAYVGTGFNLTTGVVTSGTGKIENVGNGWYRCSITATFGAANATGGISIYPTSGTSTFYTGNGTSGIFLWGAMLEAGSFQTSYIPTTTAAATRNADAASMTGVNFSSWFRQDEGTITAEYDVTGYNPAALSTFYRAISMNDGTSTNRMIIANTNTGSNLYPYGFMQTNGVTQAEFYITAAQFGINTVRKTSLAYKFNDTVFITQALSATTDTTCTVPVVTQLGIGSDPGGSNTLTGHIRRISYYPARLSNTQLQTLTQS
jgi:hypothetical protein